MSTELTITVGVDLMTGLTYLYDGTTTRTLNDSQYQVSGLALGHNLANVTITTESDNAGVYEDYTLSYDIVDAAGKSVKGEYSITEIKNDVEITKRAITVDAGSATKVYDGTALTDSKYEVLVGSEEEYKLLAGENVSVKMTADSTITHVGSRANKIDASSVTVTKADGSDSSMNYNVIVEDGTLTVTRRTVLLISASAAKYYDGTALQNRQVVVTGLSYIEGQAVDENGGFLAGDSCTYDFVNDDKVVDAKGNGIFWTVSEQSDTAYGQTDVGTSKNEFNYHNFTSVYYGSNESDYEIIYGNATPQWFVDKYGQGVADSLFGDLTVWGGPVEIKMTDYSWAYDYRAERDGYFDDGYTITFITDEAGTTKETTVFAHNEDGQAVALFGDDEIVVDVKGQGGSAETGRVYRVSDGEKQNEATYKIYRDGKDVTDEIAKYYQVAVEGGVLKITPNAEKPANDSTAKDTPKSASEPAVMTVPATTILGTAGTTYSKVEIKMTDYSWTYDFQSKANGYFDDGYSVTLTTSDGATKTVTFAHNADGEDGIKLTDTDVLYVTVTGQGGSQATGKVQHVVNDDGTTGKQNTATFKVMRGDDDVTGEYASVISVDKTGGVLKITPRTVELTSGSVRLAEEAAGGLPVTDNTVIEGAAGRDTGFIFGEGAAYEVTGKQTGLGSSENTFEISEFLTDTKATDYNFNMTLGTLSILPTITITAESDMKKYDGTALTNAGYTYTGTLAEGHKLIATVAGSQTKAGSSANWVSDYQVVNAAGEDVTETYSFKTVDGTLTVTSNDTLITITAKDATRAYDGTALTDSGYTYTGKLAAGDYFASVTVVGERTHFGEAANVVTGYVIKNQAGDDVTSFYTNIKTANGTLSVTKRNVTIASDSATKVYDGTELVKNSTKVTSADGFVAGEGYTANVIGSQTEIGASKNTFSYDLNQGTYKDDYKITTVEGDLAVTTLKTYGGGDSEQRDLDDRWTNYLSTKEIKAGAFDQVTEAGNTLSYIVSSKYVGEPQAKEWDTWTDLGDTVEIGGANASTQFIYVRELDQAGEYVGMKIYQAFADDQAPSKIDEVKGDLTGAKWVNENTVNKVASWNAEKKTYETVAEDGKSKDLGYKVSVIGTDGAAKLVSGITTTEANGTVQKYYVSDKYETEMGAVDLDDAEQGWVEYSQSDVFKFTKEGKDVAKGYYLAVADKAGNVSEAQAMSEINIDWTDATASATQTGTVGTAGWYKAPVVGTDTDYKFSVTASDELSGIAASGAVKLFKGVTKGDKTEWQEITDVTPTVTGETEATRTYSWAFKDFQGNVKYGVYDQAGNYVESEAISVKVDYTDAKIDSVTTTKDPDKETGWYNLATGTFDYVVKASDNLSGVGLVEYTLDGGKTFKYATYDKGRDAWTVKVADTGIDSQTYAFRVTDWAGNVSDLYTQAPVKVDTVAPTASKVTGTHTSQTDKPTFASGEWITDMNLVSGKGTFDLSGATKSQLADGGSPLDLAISYVYKYQKLDLVSGVRTWTDVTETEEAIGLVKDVDFTYDNKTGKWALTEAGQAKMVLPADNAGVYTFTVTAKDEAGNSTATTFDVKFDNTQPLNPTVQLLQNKEAATKTIFSEVTAATGLSVRAINGEAAGKDTDIESAPIEKRYYATQTGAVNLATLEFDENKTRTIDKQGVSLFTYDEFNTLWQGSVDQKTGKMGDDAYVIAFYDQNEAGTYSTGKVTEKDLSHVRFVVDSTAVTDTVVFKNGEDAVKSYKDANGVTWAKADATGKATLTDTLNDYWVGDDATAAGYADHTSNVKSGSLKVGGVEVDATTEEGGILTADFNGVGTVTKVVTTTEDNAGNKGGVTLDVALDNAGPTAGTVQIAKVNLIGSKLVSAYAGEPNTYYVNPGKFETEEGTVAKIKLVQNGIFDSYKVGGTAAEAGAGIDLDASYWTIGLDGAMGFTTLGFEDGGRTTETYNAAHDGKYNVVYTLVDNVGNVTETQYTVVVDTKGATWALQEGCTYTVDGGASAVSPKGPVTQEVEVTELVQEAYVFNWASDYTYTWDLEDETSGLVQYQSFTKDKDGKWVADGLPMPLDDEFSTIAISGNKYTTDLEGAVEKKFVITDKTGNTSELLATVKLDTTIDGSVKVTVDDQSIVNYVEADEKYYVNTTKYNLEYTEVDDRKSGGTFVYGREDSAADYKQTALVNNFASLGQVKTDGAETTHQAIITDAAGNQKALDDVTVVVDTTKATITLENEVTKQVVRDPEDPSALKGPEMMSKKAETVAAGTDLAGTYDFGWVGKIGDTGTAGTITIQVADTNLSEVEISQNGGDPEKYRPGSELSFKFTNLVEGKNTSTIKATDKAGNVTESEVTVWYDVTGPTISLDEVNGSKTNYIGETYASKGNETATGDKGLYLQDVSKVTFTINAVDLKADGTAGTEEEVAGVYGVYYTVSTDGGENWSEWTYVTPIDAENGYEVTINAAVGGTVEGIYRFAAVDFAGNSATTDFFTVKADEVAPTNVVAYNRGETVDAKNYLIYTQNGQQIDVTEWVHTKKTDGTYDPVSVNISFRNADKADKTALTEGDGANEKHYYTNKFDVAAYNKAMSGEITKEDGSRYTKEEALRYGAKVAGGVWAEVVEDSTTKAGGLPVSTSFTVQDHATYYFYSADEAGNVSDYSSNEVRIDNIAPILEREEVSLVGEPGKFAFRMLATDLGGSQLNTESFKMTSKYAITVEIDGQETTFKAGDTIKYSVGQVVKVSRTDAKSDLFTFSVNDNAGNQASEVVGNLYITKATIDGVLVEGKTATVELSPTMLKWSKVARNTVTVEFNGADRADSVEYFNGTDWVLATLKTNEGGTATFELPEGQYDSFALRVTAGGASTASTYKAGVDYTNPLIDTKTELLDGTAYVQGTWTNQDVRIVGEFSDALSGIYGRTYDERTVTTETKKLYDEEGVFIGYSNVKTNFTAKDVAGNVATDSGEYKIRIDKTDAVITASSKANGEYAEVTAKATDALSGMATFRWSYDGENWNDLNLTVTNKFDADYGSTVYLQATDKAGNLTSYELQVAKYPGTITIKANDATKTYDGTALTNAGYTYTGKLIAGDELVVTVDGSVTDVGTAVNKVTSYKVMRDGEDVTSFYKFADSVDGTLEVTKRSVTLTSASDSKTYDGTPLTNSSVTVSGDGFVDGQGATYDVTGSQTVAGSSKNTFGYTLDSNTKAGNYEITKKEGTLTVYVADAITITADSNSKMYDGTALTDSGYTVSGKLAAGDYVSNVVVTGEIICAGTAANKVTSYTILNAQGEDVTSSYKPANLIDGTLTVTPHAAITITAANESKMYDGTALTNAGYTYTGELAAGDTLLSVTVTGSITDYGTAANKVTGYKIFNAAGDDVTSSYAQAELIDGTLSITKRDVVLTSGDATKKYDGTPLTNSNVTVTGSGFVDGQGATYDGTGSQTKVGSSVNTFTYTLNGDTKADNYSISTALGTLTVTPNDTLITITADSNSKMYDGTALTDSGYTYTGKLAAGDYFASVTVVGERTHFGEAANVVTGYVIKNQAGDNVTSFYTNIQTANGTLTVTKRDVVLTSASDVKFYDGTPLTNDTITVSGSGFVAGEGATYTVTGSQTLPGSSANTFTYELNAGTYTADYSIEKVEGTLVVNPTDKLDLVNQDFNLTTGEWELKELNLTRSSLTVADSATVSATNITAKFGENAINGFVDGIENLTVKTAATLAVDKDLFREAQDDGATFTLEGALIVDDATSFDDLMWAYTTKGVDNLAFTGAFEGEINKLQFYTDKIVYNTTTVKSGTSDEKWFGFGSATGTKKADTITFGAGTNVTIGNYDEKIDLGAGSDTVKVEKNADASVDSTLVNVENVTVTAGAKVTEKIDGKSVTTQEYTKAYFADVEFATDKAGVMSVGAYSRVIALKVAGGETTANKLTVGANSSFGMYASFADLTNIQTVSVSAGTKFKDVSTDAEATQHYTSFYADDYISTAKASSLSFGNYTHVSVMNVQMDVGVDKITLGNFSEATLGAVTLGEGNDVIQIGSDAAFEAKSLDFGATDATRSTDKLTVGARSDAKIGTTVDEKFVVGDITGVNTLTTTAGKATDLTALEAGNVTMTAGADKITLGNFSDVSLGAVKLGEGNDTVQIGSDAVFTAKSLDFGALDAAKSTDKLTVGARSEVMIGSTVDETFVGGDIAGVNTLTTTAGKADDLTTLDAGDVTMLAKKANTVTIGNFSDVDLVSLTTGDLADKVTIGNNDEVDLGDVSFGAGNDTFKIGTNSHVTAGKLDFGDGNKDALTIGAGSILEVTTLDNLDLLTMTTTKGKESKLVISDLDSFNAAQEKWGSKYGSQIVQTLA